MAKERASPQCYLEPVDLSEESQFSELRRQRIICGWKYDLQTLQSWKEQKAIKTLFWITFPAPDCRNMPIRAGHISLDASSGLLEPGLLRENEIELSLSTFFILPEYRALGLGKLAVGLLEKTAVTKPYGDPRCRYLTLTALSKRYIYDKEWRGMWEKIGMPRPPFSIQEWYEKLGYVSWKDEPLYEAKALDGELITLWDALMRKDLRQGLD